MRTSCTVKDASGTSALFHCKQRNVHFLRFYSYSFSMFKINEVPYLNNHLPECVYMKCLLYVHTSIFNQLFIYLFVYLLKGNSHEITSNVLTIVLSALTLLVPFFLNTTLSERRN